MKRRIMSIQIRESSPKIGNIIHQVTGNWSNFIMLKFLKRLVSSFSEVEVGPETLLDLAKTMRKLSRGLDNLKIQSLLQGIIGSWVTDLLVS